MLLRKAGMMRMLIVRRSALTDETCQTLEQFMKSLENKETKAEGLWQEYLKNLAILISNLRMAYDMDIILGGEVGGYLQSI